MKRASKKEAKKPVTTQVNEDDGPVECEGTIISVPSGWRTLTESEVIEAGDRRYGKRNWIDVPPSIVGRQQVAANFIVIRPAAVDALHPLPVPSGYDMFYMGEKITKGSLEWTFRKTQWGWYPVTPGSVGASVLQGESFCAPTPIAKVSWRTRALAAESKLDILQADKLIRERQFAEGDWKVRALEAEKRLIKQIAVTPLRPMRTWVSGRMATLFLGLAFIAAGFGVTEASGVGLFVFGGSQLIVFLVWLCVEESK